MGARLESPETPEAPSEGRPPAEPLRLAATAEKLPDKRPLSEYELTMVRKVFGAGLRYPPIRLSRMGSFIATINGNRAYTYGNTIKLPAKAYIRLDMYPSLLVHELVHVWQFQREGWSYIPDALIAQTTGDGYDFAKGLRQGKSFRKMNPEQQAQMIQDAFRGSYFDFPTARFGVIKDKGVVVRPGNKPQEGFEDYTSTLLEGLELIRTPT